MPYGQLLNNKTLKAISVVRYNEFGDSYPIFPCFSLVEVCCEKGLFGNVSVLSLWEYYCISKYRWKEVYVYVQAKNECMNFDELIYICRT